MKHIEHIVYLMLENRSFDHVLGWLYEPNEKPNFIPDTIKEFNGLYTGNYYNPDTNGITHPVWKIPPGTDPSLPTTDPHEPYEHVNVQLFGSEQNPPPDTVPNMMGFYKDFATASKDRDQIMGCYTPDSLPILNFLAKKFAVSDEYYCSVPTQTNCNRAFAATGNSIGHYWWRPGTLEAWVDNNFADIPPWDLDVTFNQRTIWDVLSEQSMNDWRIFYNESWPDNVGKYCFTQDLFWPSLKDKTAHFSGMQEFFDMVSKGVLPKFSFLEPAWYLSWFGNGNDYHPPANLKPGESFLLKVYLSLLTQPKLWSNTLLIINFDEHGGTYDHQPPPDNAFAPWEFSEHGTPVPQVFEKDFDFKRYGVRVPLILVSPWIKESTVFRSGVDIPFDHTSVIATILSHFGISRDKWKLGSRTYYAPTFENVWSTGTLRTDLPEIELPERSSERTTSDDPVNDLQKMVMHRMIARKLQEVNFPREKYQDLYVTYFDGVTTMKEMEAARDRLLAAIEV